MEEIKMPQKDVITVAPISTREIEESTKESESVLSSVTGMKIVDNANYQWAGNFLRTIKEKVAKLTTDRKNITRPLDQAKKAVLDLFRSPLNRLEEAEGILKESMITYSNEQERIRVDAERKLQFEADKKRKEAEKKAEEFRAKGKESKAEEWEAKAETIVAPVMPSIQKAEGISYRDQWSAEVVDFKLLPEEYKIANITMLNKISQSTKGAIKIPGVVFTSEKILAAKK